MSEQNSTASAVPTPAELARQLDEAQGRIRQLENELAEKKVNEALESDRTVAFNLRLPSVLVSALRAQATADGKKIVDLVKSILLSDSRIMDRIKRRV